LSSVQISCLPYSSPPAERLSLSACAEQEEQYGIGRKARGFPQVGAAEPLLAPVLARSLDSSDTLPPAARADFFNGLQSLDASRDFAPPSSNLSQSVEAAGLRRCSSVPDKKSQLGSDRVRKKNSRVGFYLGQMVMWPVKRPIDRVNCDARHIHSGPARHTRRSGGSSARRIVLHIANARFQIPDHTILPVAAPSTTSKGLRVSRGAEPKLAGAPCGVKNRNTCMLE